MLSVIYKNSGGIGKCKGERKGKGERSEDGTKIGSFGHLLESRFLDMPMGMLKEEFFCFWMHSAT
jgi:hypothetical protein